MITYDRLWETMKEKQITQYRMIRYYGVSASQLGRLKKNMYVSTHTIEMLCNILECNVEDILEYRPDESDVLRAKQYQTNSHPILIATNR